MESYVFQYSIGGAVFLVGMYYAWRQGYLGLRGKPLRNLVVLVAGFAFFMLVQAWLEYSDMRTAPPRPYQGDGVQPGAIGTGLDYGIMIAYFVAIVAVGTWFGRGQKSTKDFFFGGQRFSWWLIAFSLIATTIGSYSFVKYSKISYEVGLASTQTYLNDWFFVPLFLFGWLPILYFSRVTSIPEYFARRFDSTARKVVTALLLLYLVGYVGVNLFTMGKALNALVGWPVWGAAAMVAVISGIYVTAGGQTSVIMTDLLQGVMLLVVGLLILYLGADYLGGVTELWENLPREHRRAFGNFNTDPDYNAVGIFWQDGMANTAMMYFLNQGVAMRFMAARSVTEARKAAIAVPILLMPVAAVVVASGGWVGRALTNAGALPPDMAGSDVFFIATEFLARPGVFGLVMAALTAALMSTVDTLVTAVAAVVVNDVYKPLRPAATEAQMLRAARVSAACVLGVGLLLVPVFAGFASIYAAHGAFTAAVTPPLVVALLLGVFWRRYTARAAVWTMAGGTIAVALSLQFPWLVEPFSFGVPAADVGDGFLAGAKQYKYTRACYGLAVSATIGVVATLLSRRLPDAGSLRGLVWGQVRAAIHHYKGIDGDEVEGRWARCGARTTARQDYRGEGRLGTVRISGSLARALDARAGDLLYVTDPRWWLGGLRSCQTIIDEVADDLGDAPVVELGPDSYWQVARHRDPAAVTLRVQKLY